MYNAFILRWKVKDERTHEIVGNISIHDITPDEAKVFESVLKRNGCTTVQRIEKAA